LARESAVARHWLNQEAERSGALKINERTRQLAMSRSDANTRRNKPLFSIAAARLHPAQLECGQRTSTDFRTREHE